MLAALALAKVTVPGPLTAVQPYVNAPGGFGKPSSVAEPFKGAGSDNAMARAGPAFAEPAFTTGGWFGGVGVGVGVGDVATTLKLTAIEAPLLPVPPVELHGAAVKV